MGSLRGFFFLKNKRIICFFVLTIFRKTTVRFHFLSLTVMAHIFRICWVLSRSLAHSTFFYGHVFSICCVCSWMQGRGRISCVSPKHGRSEGNLGSGKAHSARWEGDWGAPCQSGLAFKGLSILSPGVGKMGSGPGSLSGKMIWDHYFCCHGNFVVQCFCISSVFGACSRCVLLRTVLGRCNAFVVLA